MIEQARTAHPEVSVRRLCRLHGVSRSWYLRRRHRHLSDKCDEGLAQDIEAIVLIAATAIAGLRTNLLVGGVRSTTNGYYG